MMRRISLLLILSTLLVSCDRFGSGNVKNLVDLTLKLEIEQEEKLRFNSSQTTQDLLNNTKYQSYNFSKNSTISEPTIAKNILYTTDMKGFVSAYSLKEKKILWTTDIARDAIDRSFYDGGVLFSDGKLYITNSSRYLVILDANSGDEILRKEFPDIIRNKPVMANDRLLLVQTVSNQLIAYDIKMSKFAWVHEGGAEIISTRNHVHPAVYNGHAIVSYSSGEIIYIDAESGKVKWSYNLVKIDDIGIPSFDPLVIVTDPLIVEEYAYFTTSNGKIIKMDLDNGAPVWVKDAEDVQSLSLIGDYLLITNNARQVAALSTHNGKVLWVGDLLSEKDRKKRKIRTAVFQKPFISQDGNIFTINVISSDGECYKFIQNKDGFISSSPSIVKIKHNIKNYWISCCTGDVYLMTDRTINSLMQE
jgi:outer membrane protein assembly factor BamB